MAHGFRNLLGVGLVVLVLAAVANPGDDDSPAAAAPPAGAKVAYAKPLAHGTVTSEFAKRWGTFHYGLDIAAPLGTPIRAVASGVVIVAGPASGFGLWMKVRHPDGTVTVYGHMNTMDRAVGAHVAAGERIATVGARGEATGPHVHVEVWPGGDRDRRVNPRGWLAHRGVRLAGLGVNY